MIYEGTSNDDSANAIYNGVDDSWGAKSHVESGSKGGWSHQKKHEDHWGHKEGKNQFYRFQSLAPVD